MDQVLWQVELLRATAFYSPDNLPSDVTRVWLSAQTRQPDEVSSRPNEGIQLAQGSFGGSDKQLQCAIRRDRVDWIFQPAPPPPNRAPEGLLSIGTLAGALTPFRELTARWLEASPESTRLAFGAVLLFEVSSPSHANEMLNGLLPSVNLDSEGVFDFLYRVNRRKSLESHDGTLVNRLSTWSAVQGNAVRVVVPGGGQPQLIQQPDHFACRLELDMNTIAVPSVALSRKEATTVFDELVSLGVDIAEQGDKP